MFTGIVQTTAPVVKVARKRGLTTFAVRFPRLFLQGLKRGTSVAIDGVCLTVTRINQGDVWFDAMAETLRKTTLGKIKIGSRVNLERSAKMSDEIGGHVVSGHVTGMAMITRVQKLANNRILTFKVPRAFMRYIFPKGFIALDGASLTIVDVDRGRATFTVHLIPETLRLTTFGFKKAGDQVNVEIDSRTQTIVETVAALLHKR